MFTLKTCRLQNQSSMADKKSHVQIKQQQTDLIKSDKLFLQELLQFLVKPNQKAQNKEKITKMHRMQWQYNVKSIYGQNRLQEEIMLS
jgi:hypothetical protein